MKKTALLIAVVFLFGACHTGRQLSAGVETDVPRGDTTIRGSLFTDKLSHCSKVKNVSTMPDILIPRSSSFTNIREAAVRMQSDLVLVYAINSDIYSKYKAFSSPDYKAYATVQLVLLDVRTGLIPFSTIITKDNLSRKKKEELDVSEAMNRVQREAVLSAIDDAGQRIALFLTERSQASQG